MRYIIIGAISFLVSTALTLVFLFYGRSLLLEGSDKAIVYLLILAPLGICCSFLLFRVLHSYAKITGKIYNQKIIISGPAGMFVVVMAIGYYFYSHPPIPQIFKLTIAFKDSLSGKPLDGMATVTYGSAFESKKLFDGIIHYPNVNPNTKITIDPHITGYMLNGSHNFMVPDNNTALTIQMVPLQEDQILRQYVLNRFTQYTNDYYNRAYNLADFMQTNSKYLFADTGSYFKELGDDMLAYNKAFDTLFALRENLSTSISEFAPSFQKDAANFMTDFEAHHKSLFKIFLNERQDTLVDFQIIDKMTRPMRLNFIERMEKNGQNAIAWLEEFKSNSDQIKRRLSF